MNANPVLILGARSDIALAIARCLAGAGHDIQLAARDIARLEADRADIALRGNVAVTLHDFDVLASDRFENFVDSLPTLPAIVISAIGSMNPQALNENDVVCATRDIRSNFEGPALILGVFANLFEARGHGVIVGISSVAGERGRAKNYVYGSAKAGFSAFLSGMRNRLARSGVRVLTVKLGFAATRMTEGMDLPTRLTAEPEEVAAAVISAIRRRKDVVFVRPVWRLVMMIIRAIPERLFKRMNI